MRKPLMPGYITTYFHLQISHSAFLLFQPTTSSLHFRETSLASYKKKSHGGEAGLWMHHCDWLDESRIFSRCVMCEVWGLTKWMYTEKRKWWRLMFNQSSLEKQVQAVDHGTGIWWVRIDLLLPKKAGFSVSVVSSSGTKSCGETVDGD